MHQIHFRNLCSYDFKSEKIRNLAICHLFLIFFFSLKYLLVIDLVFLRPTTPLRRPTVFCLPLLQNLIQVEPASVVDQEVLHLNHRLVADHV